MKTIQNSGTNINFEIDNNYGTIQAPGVTYADALIMTSQDSKFNNAANATYFQADKIHRTTSLDNIQATVYEVPLVQTL